MKKQKQRNSNRTPELDDSGPLDWTPWFRAFKEAFEWALDVAVGLAEDFPEEVEAVHRVRAFMHKRIAGQPAHCRVDDVLFTFALIIGAIERDLGPVKNLGPWFGAPMRFPGAEELWSPSIPRRVIASLNTNRARA